MKIHLHFRSAGIYLLALLVTLSFPLSVYAEQASPTTVSETAEIEPSSTEPVASDSTEPDQSIPDSTSSSTIQNSDSASEPPAGTDLQAATTETVTSTSGDASIVANGTAGSAKSGSATADTTVTTVINSQTDLANAGTFTKDITGTVFGDITLDALVSNSLKNTSSAVPAKSYPLYSSPSSTQLGANQSIVVTALSGDASVLDNSLAGDAITGDAIAHANSISVINSALQSQGTFVGTVNILGDLDGDIFISPDFLPSLVSASSLAGSKVPSLTPTTTDVNVNTALLLSAISGNAEVSKNSEAGNAVSGDASTNLLTYTLIGSQLAANSSLLVFVNVLGEWVGSIVASPSGATTALLASDVSHQGVVPYALIQNTSITVNNDIRVTARSGDALVSGNSVAGSAISGKAMASANVLTMINSSMNLSGWLGILFINVYGNWHGSFGIDTAYGNLPTPTSPAVVPVVMTPASSSAVFVPSAARSTRHTSLPFLAVSPVVTEVSSTTSQAVEHDMQKSEPAVLGEETHFNGPSSPSKIPFVTLFALVTTALGALLYAGRSLRQRFAEA